MLVIPANGEKDLELSESLQATLIRRAISYVHPPRITSFHFWDLSFLSFRTAAVNRAAGYSTGTLVYPSCA